MSLWSPRAPLGRAVWDAWFFIAIFPNGEWCKVHLFSGGKPHCLSALEGLDGPPQELALVGRLDEITRRGSRIEAVVSDGVSVRGADVSFALSEEARIGAPGIDALVRATEPFYWIRVPRVLTYFTTTGAAKVTTGGSTREGLGLLEHAWGARTCVDVARFAPRRWQWDVLSLGGSRYFAGLAFGAAGVAALSRVNGLRVRVHEWSSTGDRRIPRRWTGTMVTRAGALRYEARSATPVAPEVDGGGFLGFTWEGELAHRVERGGGFCEYRANPS